MPTENRSSNTEKALTFTESSLAAALEKVQSLHDLGCGLIAEAVFQQPAEQLQGEPVAWMDPRSPQMHATISNEVKQHNAKFGGAPASAVNGYTIPLYTHADPGEVERLRQQIEGLVDANTKFAKWHSHHLVQLAERNALLNRGVQAWAAAESIKDMHPVMAAMRDALSASAEPSRPAGRDELTRMVDAAMREMSNIHPPLRRGDCARLIRAALDRQS